MVINKKRQYDGCLRQRWTDRVNDDIIKFSMLLNSNNIGQN